MSPRRPRQHDDKHLDFVRRLPCIICHKEHESEACHIRMGARWAGKIPTGMGQKSSDRWVVPMCREHHEMQHQYDEEKFWISMQISPFAVAAYLWGVSGDHELGEQIVREASVD